MKVLMTGSRGFVGSALKARLESSGHEVTALSSASPQHFTALGAISDSYELPKKVDAVVYLAQSPHYRDGEQLSHLLNVNCFSAVRLLELSRRQSVKRFIYFSSGSVYAPSFEKLSETAPVRRNDPYAMSKVHAEEALRALTFPGLHILRPFTLYGPGPGQEGKLIARLVKSLLNADEITLDANPSDPTDDGGVRLSVTYIDTVVDTVVRLLDSGGPPLLNLSGAEVLSLKTLVQKIAAPLGANPRFKSGANFRQCDWVADVSQLKSSLAPDDMPFGIGIQKTLEYMKA